MRLPLRAFIYRRLIVATLACGLTAGLGVAVAGAFVFQGVIQASEDAAYREAQGRFDLFDLLASRIESENRANGRRALAELARRFPSMDAVKGLGVAELHQVAAGLGVSELYFIAPDLTIRATSFAPDLGLDLRAIGNQPFVDFLAPLLGSGRFADQRLSQSAMTGEVHNYQYYGPKGSGYILEVSTRLTDTVPSLFPGMDYRKLVGLAFNQGTGEGIGSLVSFTDCLFVSANEVHSFALERKVEAGVEALVRKAERSGGEAEARVGANIMKVRRLLFALRDYDYSDTSYAVFEFNRRPLWVFFAGSAIVALVAGAGTAFVSFLALRRSFRRRFTGRIEALESAMAKVGAGSLVHTLDDGGGDEIASIGRSADAMVSEIRTRSVELAAFARRLEEELAEREVRERNLSAALEENKALVREVSHRVNNNLQVLLSLVDFQAQGCGSDETRLALSRTKARLFTMALVQDQLLSTPSLVSVDMQEMVSSLAVAIRSAHPRTGPQVTCAVDARGVAFPADRAVAVALAASELLDNAYRHAFPEAGRGWVRAGLRREGKDGFVLEVEDDGGGGAEAEGLGLKIVGAMAAQLAGRLEIRSGVGRGSLIRIVVPG